MLPTNRLYDKLNRLYHWYQLYQVSVCNRETNIVNFHISQKSSHVSTLHLHTPTVKNRLTQNQNIFIKSHQDPRGGVWRQHFRQFVAPPLPPPATPNRATSIIDGCISNRYIGLPQICTHENNISDTGNITIT
jgi:hypothetical protein